MHEVSIACELTGIVLEEARKACLSKVTRVSICFGELVQIVPEIFEFAYREIVRDTIAEDSELEIKVARVEMICRVCGRRFNVDENNFRCSVCNSDELDFVHGNELFVKSIEGE